MTYLPGLSRGVFRGPPAAHLGKGRLTKPVTGGGGYAGNHGRHPAMAFAVSLTRRESPEPQVLKDYLSQLSRQTPGVRLRYTIPR